MTQADLGGEPPRGADERDAGPDADFDDVTPEGVPVDLVTFTEHWERSREVMAARPLDAALRWHYLYLIKEYARHLGHADLLRERVDGATGE